MRREGGKGRRVNLRSVRDVWPTSFLQYRINCFQRRNDFIGRSDLRSFTCLGGIYCLEMKAIILLSSILALRHNSGRYTNEELEIEATR